MKYAIVESGGKQYRAVEGGTIEVDRLPVETGANVKLEQILLIADGENITVGIPVVKDNPVWTKVLEHFKGEKVTIFNYSPKKRIRVKTGHRQNYTRLLIEQVGGSELVKKEPVEEGEKSCQGRGRNHRSESRTSEESPGCTRKAPAKAEKKPAAKSCCQDNKTFRSEEDEHDQGRAQEGNHKAAPKAAPKKPAEKKK